MLFSNTCVLPKLLGTHLVFLCLAPSLANFVSRTTEFTGLARGDGFCFDPANELAIMQPYNFTFYGRRPIQEAAILPQQTSRKLQAPAGVPVEKLDSIYRYPTIVSSKQLEEGISNMGDTRRLERVIWKLVTGQPVTVVALGGSVTAGTGVLHPENCWTSRVFHWIRTTFPNDKHIFLNKAIPAVTSAYTSPCVQTMVPENTDLILLEFTFNDAERSTSFTLDDPTRRGLERLLRKLLRRTNNPALLYMHFCPFPLRLHYWEGAEDSIDVLMKFYGVPSLSMRNALHTMLETQPALLDQLWKPAREHTFNDRLHPSCVGTRYMSDLVIGHLQDIAAFVLKAYSGAPQAPHGEMLQDTLRQPIFSANHAEQPETCLLDDQFKGLVTGGQGWIWVNEGKLPTKPKWGFVSTTVGAQLFIKVPLAGMVFKDNKLLIALGVLMSYQHMGYARLDCVAGCMCPSREISLLHPFRFSQTYWKTLNVSLFPGSLECNIAVTNIIKTRSNEHKLKITSLMISGELGFVESWTHCPDCN